MKLNNIGILCCVLGFTLPVAAYFGAGNDAFAGLAVFSTPLLFLTGSILGLISWRKGIDKRTALVVLLLNLIALLALIILAYIWITGFADMLN